MVQSYNNNIIQDVAILLASVKEDLKSCKSSIYAEDNEEKTSKPDPFRSIVDTKY